MKAINPANKVYLDSFRPLAEKRINHGYANNFPVKDMLRIYNEEVDPGDRTPEGDIDRLIEMLKKLYSWYDSYLAANTEPETTITSKQKKP